MLNFSPVVLDSEVVDLRVCLQSADRELAELKGEMKKEKKSHDSKTMDLLRRVRRPETSCVVILSLRILYTRIVLELGAFGMRFDPL